MARPSKLRHKVRFVDALPAIKRGVSQKRRSKRDEVQSQLQSNPGVWGLIAGPFKNASSASSSATYHRELWNTNHHGPGRFEIAARGRHVFAMFVPHKLRKAV